MMTDPITTDQALNAAARLIAELVGGLTKTPEGRTEVILSLIAGLPRARDAAEAEIVRRVLERLRG